METKSIVPEDLLASRTPRKLIESLLAGADCDIGMRLDVLDISDVKIIGGRISQYGINLQGEWNTLEQKWRLDLIADGREVPGGVLFPEGKPSDETIKEAVEKAKTLGEVFEILFGDQMDAEHDQFTPTDVYKIASIIERVGFFLETTGISARLAAAGVKGGRDDVASLIAAVGAQKPVKSKPN